MAPDSMPRGLHHAHTWQGVGLQELFARAYGFYSRTAPVLRVDRYPSVPSSRPCLILLDFFKSFDSFCSTRAVGVKVCPNKVRNKDSHSVGILLSTWMCLVRCFL